MSGYNIDRFVNLSETERDELTCSLCLDILCCPVVSPCCSQMFCECCINEWLQTNNTCPYDRIALTKSGLTRPPRALVNILQNLKISCDYKDKGCREVVKLENLTRHTVSCKFNIKKCSKCTCTEKPGHNCVQELLALLKDAKLQISQQNVEINELKKELDLTRSNISGMSPARAQNTTQNSEVDDAAIFKSARTNILDHQIIVNKCDDDMTENIMRFVRQYILEYNSFFEFSKSLKKKLDDEFGDSWHVIAGKRYEYNSVFSYNKYYLDVVFDRLSIVIHATHSGYFGQFKQRFQSGKIRREFDIQMNDMNETMISDVKTIVFDAIDKSNDFVEMANNIYGKMISKYPTYTWQIFTKDFYGNHSIVKESGTRINFKIGNVNFLIFGTKK